ncbi:hypothetical protein B0J13DRAFT_524463 [Dactylonectria estremocensis]|uniref:Uncharacterized protein n=1 Tax=Dactylonectria estremocensis TaxID=1079267 RepID=A0A9P9EWL7_9HYPO|nr:hypothetical protein B0J13DRAFT_524463 [Dactylonectria estremocensis]
MPLVGGNLSVSGAISPAQEQVAIDWAKGSPDFGEGLIPSTPHTVSLPLDDSMFSAPLEGVLSPTGASPSDLFSPVGDSPSLSPSANDTTPGLSNPLDPNPLKTLWALQTSKVSPLPLFLMAIQETALRMRMSNGLFQTERR